MFSILVKTLFSFLLILSAGAVIANIYAVLPLSKYGANFLSRCKFVTFRNNMYYGPIEWKTGPWATSSEVSTPDLKELITPILRSDDATINKRLYLLFEWKEFTIRSSLTGTPGKNLVLRYHDKTSSKFHFSAMLREVYPGDQILLEKSLIPRIREEILELSLYGGCAHENFFIRL